MRDIPTEPPTSSRLMSKVVEYFDIVAKGTSVRTELFAGASTFLALSYIFVVNPAILAQAGMNKSAVLFATIITSSLATLAMGMWARLPFVLAPGMEMNAYVAFFVVGALGFTWQQALGAVFWSGVLFVVLTISRIRERIIDAIPDQMKSGLSLSVGVFLALVALKLAGVLRYDGVRLQGFGGFTTPDALALYVSFALVLFLSWIRLPGAVMISILATTGFCHAIGMGNRQPSTEGISAAALSAVWQLAFSAILQMKMLSVIVILFLIDFYGSIAKLIGLTMDTNIAPNGRLPRMREALLIDSIATTGGAALGTSSLTIYVESGVGIAAGGRTGLTAVVCGALMLSCLGLAPFLANVPAVAASGSLLFLAITLFPSRAALQRMKTLDRVMLLSMPLTVLATFALDKAMLVGYIPYLYRDLRLRKLNRYMLISFCLLLLGVLAQMR